MTSATKRDQVALELREMRKLGIRVPDRALTLGLARIGEDDLEHGRVSELADLAINLSY